MCGCDRSPEGSHHCLSLVVLVSLWKLKDMRGMQGSMAAKAFGARESKMGSAERAEMTFFPLFLEGGESGKKVSTLNTL